MLRVPPAPAPTRSIASCIAASTTWMLAHAQVIVGTPDGNLILQTMIKGLRKVAGASLQVRKDSISIFASDELETRLKELVEIHRFPLRISTKSSGTDGDYCRLSARPPGRLLAMKPLSDRRRRVRSTH